jgi:hypothetical protein
MELWFAMIPIILTILGMVCIRDFNKKYESSKSILDKNNNLLNKLKNDLQKIREVTK